MKNKLIVQDKLVTLTPEVLAELFANLDDTEQAQFFNRVAEVASTWGIGAGFVIQLQAITDNEVLTLAGRRTMQYIGEYSHWGLVPKAKPLPELLTTEMEDALWDAKIHPVHGWD